MRRAVILAPVLAAAFPILFLYAHNVDEVTASAATPVLLIAILGALLLTGAFYLAFRDEAMAALAATGCVLFILMYGHIYDLLAGWMPFGLQLSHWLAMPALLLVVTLAVALLLRNRRRATEFMPYLTLALGGLAAFNLASALIPEFQRLGGPPRDDVLAPVAGQEGPLDGPLPDIYYIVPDRYPSSRILDSYFRYDNSEFTGYLEKTGFYVAEDSFANYHETFLSLASSLNFDYLERLTLEFGVDERDKTPAFEMMSDNAAWRTLKEEFGYKFVHFGSWWGPTENNPHADVEINKHPRLFGVWELNNQFSRQVFWTTALRPFSDAILERESFSQDQAEVDRCEGYVPSFEAPPNDMAIEQCHRTLHTLQQLREMPHVQGPKFVFVHLTLPHPPFIFGPEGELRDPPPFYYWDRLSPGQLDILKGRFTDQLTYTNSMLEETIDQILANSSRPPVIVLQADEGPWTPEYVHEERHDLSLETLQVRHEILNAYYLPGADTSVLYPSISPVNTFRVIFNEYFGADLPLLEDKAFRSTYWFRPYEFVEVTDQLQTAQVDRETADQPRPFGSLEAP